MADVLVELEATGVLPPVRTAAETRQPVAAGAVSVGELSSPSVVPVAPAILPQSAPAAVAQPDVASTYAAARALLEEAKSRSAQLDQREQMLRQRERELADQRRVLAEEYRLLRTQRPACCWLLRSPALYEVKDGKPALLNFQVHEGTYVVPKVLDKGYLALGKERFDFLAAGAVVLTAEHLLLPPASSDAAAGDGCRPPPCSAWRSAARCPDLGNGGRRRGHAGDHADRRTSRSSGAASDDHGTGASSVAPIACGTIRTGCECSSASNARCASDRANAECAAGSIRRHAGSAAARSGGR